MVGDGDGLTGISFGDGIIVGDGFGSLGFTGELLGDGFGSDGFIGDSLGVGVGSLGFGDSVGVAVGSTVGSTVGDSAGDVLVFGESLVLGVGVIPRPTIEPTTCRRTTRKCRTTKINLRLKLKLHFLT